MSKTPEAKIRDALFAQLVQRLRESTGGKPLSAELLADLIKLLNQGGVPVAPSMDDSDLTEEERLLVDMTEDGQIVPGPSKRVTTAIAKSMRLGTPLSVAALSRGVEPEQAYRWLEVGKQETAAASFRNFAKKVQQSTALGFRDRLEVQVEHASRGARANQWLLESLYGMNKGYSVHSLDRLEHLPEEYVDRPESAREYARQVMIRATQRAQLGPITGEISAAREWLRADIQRLAIEKTGGDEPGRGDVTRRVQLAKEGGGDILGAMREDALELAACVDAMRSPSAPMSPEDLEAMEGLEVLEDAG